jgi:rhodanese-related sulfurtransferase
MSEFFLAQISPEELSKVIAQESKQVQLIDVREPEEIAIASLPNFINLPLSQFSEWGKEINTLVNADLETLVICHHGVRSAQMCQWLLNIGFTNVKNVSGGIDAYSLLVDPSIPRY